MSFAPRRQYKQMCSRRNKICEGCHKAINQAKQKAFQYERELAREGRAGEERDEGQRRGEARWEGAGAHSDGDVE